MPIFGNRIVGQSPRLIQPRVKFIMIFPEDPAPADVNFISGLFQNSGFVIAQVRAR
jgi:hypothetical protein